MPRKTATTKTRPPGEAQPHRAPELGWTTSEHFEWNGRHIEPGTELSVSRESGRFRFVRHVRTRDGREWVDAVGIDTKGVGTSWRSFRPDRIKTVHRTRKTRPA